MVPTTHYGMAMAALVLAPATYEFNNPPWFCKQLPEPTTEDIEIRIYVAMFKATSYLRTRTHQFNLYR